MKKVVLLQVFNRPEMFARSLGSLAQFDWTGYDFIAYMDGPRVPEDVPLMQECERMARASMLNIEVRKRKKNKFVIYNTFDSFQHIFDQDKADVLIMIEDDVVLKPGYKKWIEEQLARYEDNDSVFGISCSPAGPDQGPCMKFTSWGFCTTARKWHALAGHDVAWGRFLCRIFGPVMGFVWLHRFHVWRMVRKMRLHPDHYFSWRVHSNWDHITLAMLVRKEKKMVFPAEWMIEHVGVDASSCWKR
jgi:hypothetical protein